MVLKNIESFLKSKNIPYQLREHEATPTSEDSAAITTPSPSIGVLIEIVGGWLSSVMVGTSTYVALLFL